ncbi:MAG: amino acid permease [Alphaproteobacteria bacterium]|nr:amino acid permease [Alphaproteobacteria bacterium]
MTQKKLGFGSVLAIVFGSQIGSGIFVVPSVLAPFGAFSVLGWILAGLGALLLAFVFAGLCEEFPKTGGPHVYIQKMFGRLPAFFTGWTYWLISWISSSVVVITAVACLHPFFGEYQSPILYLTLEIALLIGLTYINCRSVVLSGKLQFVLTILKFIPFVAVPAIIFKNFDASNAVVLKEYADRSVLSLIPAVTAIAFWCFIGVESATTPAEAVENPSVTIPRAIVLGTVSVALIYIINHIAIMGVLPSAKLVISKAPFVDAINAVIGKNVSLSISIITSLVCIGTLNAWILTSAQISLGLAQANLLPRIFARKNSAGSPYVSVLISCLGMIPILIFTLDQNLSAQITYIIDFSVKSFLIVYLICCLAYIKLSFSKKAYGKLLIAITATFFCIGMIVESSLTSILLAMLFTVSGVFVIPFIPNDSKNSHQ